MKYKFSRNEIQQSFVEIVKLCEIPIQIYSTFLSNLLAQKEDRKEKVELFNVTGVPLNTPIMFKRKNGRIGYGKVNPTPSPLEEFVEMKEITDKHDVIVFGRNPLDDTFLIIKNLNQLISNQKKLYQYIKEKK